MVQLAFGGQNPRTLGPIRKVRSDNSQLLQNERCLEVRMRRVGYPRDYLTLSPTEVCRVSTVLTVCEANACYAFGDVGLQNSYDR